MSKQQLVLLLSWPLFQHTLRNICVSQPLPAGLPHHAGGFKTTKKIIRVSCCFFFPTHHQLNWINKQLTLNSDVNTAPLPPHLSTPYLAYTPAAT